VALDRILSLVEQRSSADEIRSDPAFAALSASESLAVAQALNDTGEPGGLVLAAQLAKVAFETNTDGAGPVFAHCLDRMSLYSRRPQPFGTVTFEHEGEVLLAPVDPATTDEMRADYGVASLAELRSAAGHEAKRLATQRWGQPLPEGQPFWRVWSEPTAAEIHQRLRAEQANAWADGDVLTFAVLASQSVTVTPVFGLATWRVNDELQVLQVAVDRLQEAVITYQFRSSGRHDGRFRGSRAPEEMPSNNPLSGTLVEDYVESTHLGEPRRVTVYQPPGYSRHGTIPVIFATDGNMFAPFARRLDAAIVAGICPPVLVVAAHSAQATAQNRRAMEYLNGFDARIHGCHERFFVEELTGWAADRFGASTERANRAVFGTSDGAGHALSAGLAHRDKFGHIFAYSTATMPTQGQSWDPTLVPRVELCAGTLEGPFHTGTAAWADFFQQLDAPHHFTERVSGHDLIQWCEELPRSIGRAWG